MEGRIQLPQQRRAMSLRQQARRLRPRRMNPASFLRPYRLHSHTESTVGPFRQRSHPCRAWKQERPSIPRSHRVHSPLRFGYLANSQVPSSHQTLKETPPCRNSLPYWNTRDTRGAHFSVLPNKTQRQVAVVTSTSRQQDWVERSRWERTVSIGQTYCTVVGLVPSRAMGQVFRRPVVQIPNLQTQAIPF